MLYGRKLLATATVFSWLTMTPLTTLAASINNSNTDAIAIDPITVSACGEQEITFTGSATYSEPTQHLVITLDDTELLHDEDEPADWSTGPITVAEGSYTLTATIYDLSDHQDIMISDSLAFTVPSCDSPDADTSESADDGDEQDCCPGPDPIVLPVVAPGKVKSATIAADKLPAQLQPLNSLFRQVYDRDPTFNEWQYWAGRLLNDKPELDVLLGAMQWHQLRGRTIGH